MRNRILLLLFSFLAAPSRADGLEPGNCPMEIYFKGQDNQWNRYSIHTNMLDGGAYRLSDLPGNCWVSATLDRWIVHLQNTCFEGAIATYAGVELDLEGTNLIEAHSTIWFDETSILDTGSLTIVGPGSLSIYHSAGDTGMDGGGDAFAVSTGWVAIRDGATVEIYGWGRSGGGISASSAIIENSVVNVSILGSSAFSLLGYKGISVGGNLLVSDSIVTVGSYGSAITARTADVERSCVHALSATGEGFVCGGVDSVYAVDSVLCACGRDSAIRMDGLGNNPDQTLFFKNSVVTAVSRETGIKNPPHLAFLDTDAVVVGNAWEEYGIDWVFSGRGVGIFQQSESFNLYQSGGRVRVNAPGNIGIATHATYVVSGTLEIGAAMSASSLKARYLGTAISSGMASVAPGFPFQSRLGEASGWASEFFDTFFSKHGLLWEGIDDKPDVGHAADLLSVSGGKVSVRAGTVGVLLGHLPSGAFHGTNGRIVLSDGTVSVSSDAVGMCDWTVYSGGSGGTRVSGPEIGVTGGRLDVSGRKSGILLQGSVVQKGGTLRASSGSSSPSNVSQWPHTVGFAMLANGGLSRNGGTFFCSPGAVHLAGSYATATGMPVYLLSFNAAGGTVSTTTKTVVKGKAAGTLPKPKRKGCLFLGWYTAKSGGKRVTSGTKPNADLTVYARWAKKNYKVKFVANGGKGKMSVQKMTYGKAAKLKTNKFRKSGCVFKGWAKSKAGAKKGKVAFKNRKKVKNLVTSGKTVKLYAVWKNRRR